MTATRFLQGGARKPRHMICFASSDKWVSRSVQHDPNGRPLLVCEADDITTLRLDLSNLLEDGESIAAAKDTASGVTSAIWYETPFVYLTVSNPSSCHDGHVLLSIMTTLQEQYDLRIAVRLPKRHNETRRVGAMPFDRGSVSGAPAGTPASPATPSDSFNATWAEVDW